MQIAAVAAGRLDALDDGALVGLAQSGDGVAVRLIMQRHNRRLFRVARGVLHDDAEAEDVVQETYVRAFTHLDSFRGESQLSTWLTRIVLNEALGRLRRRRLTVGLKDIDAISDQGEARVIYLPSARQDSDPEAAAARAEVRRLLERAVDQLPNHFRVVFMLRDIEEMSVEETASHLGLRPEAVKTRLHRARRLLRAALDKTLASALADVFPCAGALHPDHRRRAGVPRHPRAITGVTMSLARSESSQRSRQADRQKVVVITGASAGVGRATAIAFARRGWRVALLARGLGGLEDARRDVERAGDQAIVFPADVADPEAIAAARDTVVAEWGGIHVWVNNAMATVYAPVEEITPAEFKRVTEVTYLGQVHGTLAALKHMRQQGAGTIVQVGSALAYRSIPLQSAC